MEMFCKQLILNFGSRGSLHLFKLVLSFLDMIIGAIWINILRMCYQAWANNFVNIVFLDQLFQGRYLKHSVAKLLKMFPVIRT